MVRKRTNTPQEGLFAPSMETDLEVMSVCNLQVPAPKIDWRNSSRYKKRPFKAAETGAFDARRGFHRFDPPGVEVELDGHPKAVADLWRDPEGRVRARLTSNGWVESVEVMRVNGKPITDRDTGALMDYVTDLVFYWVIEGIDDTPPFCSD